MVTYLVHSLLLDLVPLLRDIRQELVVEGVHGVEVRSAILEERKGLLDDVETFALKDNGKELSYMTKTMKFQDVDVLKKVS